jgi:hypothetical protein
MDLRNGAIGLSELILIAALVFAALALVFRFMRKGSRAGSRGLSYFLVVKLANGFFFAVAFTCLLGPFDQNAADFLASHLRFAVGAGIAGLISSVQALLSD